MRVAFAGTPEFAGAALARIQSAGHTVPLVLTQPDRPAGRGLQLQPSAVKQFAQAHGLALAQPRSLRLDGKYPDDARTAQAALQAAQPEVLVVAAYGLILPAWVLALPRLGCLNIHASLLPRWRGAAPIQRAIEAGDGETGITIMQMDAGLDTGAMLHTVRTPIEPHDTAGSLLARLSLAGGDAIVEALARAARGALQPVPQPAEGVSYAHKVEKAQAAVDWSQPAEAVGRHIRAFDPAPGATSLVAGETVKLWRYEIDSYSDTPDAGCGTILSATDAGVAVACGSGVLRLTELQRAGGRRLAAGDFLRGCPLKAGQRFGSA